MATPELDGDLLHWLVRSRWWRQRPDQPVLPTLSDISHDSLTVSWTAPESVVFEIVDYDVQYRAAGAAGFADWDYDRAATRATITGLAEDTEYRVRVRAVSEVGEGDWSATASGTTLVAPPSFVEGESADRELEENTPPGEPIGEPVVATVSRGALRYSLAGAGAEVFAIDASSGQLRTRQGITYNHEARASYAVEVEARDARGGTGRIAVRIAVLDVEEPPGKPGAPTVSTFGSTGLRVTWTAPSNEGPDISDYDVEYRARGTEDYLDAEHEGTTTRATITGLARETLYEVRVRAANDEGIGEWSATSQGRTPSSGGGGGGGGGGTLPPPPPPVRNVPPVFDGPMAFTVNENLLAVGRVQARDPDSGDPVTGYRIVGGADGFLFEIAGTGDLRFRSAPDWEQPSDSESADPSSARGDNEYVLSVEAAAGIGSRRLTIKGTVTILVADVALEAPDAPGLTRESSTSVRVRWSPPYNTGPAIEDYDVQYRAAGTNAYADAVHDGLALDAKLEGMNPATNYEARVRAVNADGPSRWSAPGAESMVENRAPVFPEAAPARSLTENAGANENIGEPIAAEDADADELEYSLGGADASIFDIDPGTGQLRTRDGATYDHETRARYTLRVNADDGRGGRASVEATINVLDADEPPGAPTAPTVANATRERLTVAWTAPENSGPAITDYWVRYRDVAAGVVALLTRNGTSREVAIPGLTPGNSYEIRVRAANAEGNGDWSESTAGSALANGAPSFAEANATRALEENTAERVDVGAPVSATDPEFDALVYSLEGTDAASFGIIETIGQLRTRTRADYDYEEKASYSVTVRAEDPYGASATAAVTINIVDLQDTGPVANAGWDLTVAVGGTAYLDGANSSAETGTPTWTWTFDSWPGDDAPTLDDGADPTPSFMASEEGAYVVRLTVESGTESATDTVTVTAVPSAEAGSLTRADLLVDANRDGQVNLSDEAGEDTWDATSGAVFGPNVDDDNQDGQMDGIDSRVGGEADLRDMAPIVVRRMRGLNRTHTVAIEMIFSGTSVRPRLFRRRAENEFDTLTRGGAGGAELPAADIVAGDLQLYLDNVYGRREGFDGNLSLKLTVEAGGATVSEDEVALRGSPILFSHHLQPAERVFVVHTSNNGALRAALAAHLPGSVDLYEMDRWKYGGDRWAQDFMQTGYIQRPSGSGFETVRSHVQLHRPNRPLADFLRDDYLRPDSGFIYRGGDRRKSLNWGGNVEIIPPHTHDGKTYPFGRIVIGRGRGSDRMVQRQLDFFDAQAVQGPPISVYVRWLWVAHVDEVFQFVENHNAGTGDREWVVVIASPDKAIELLENASDAGHGAAVVFEGRDEETTVDEILADADLLDDNDDAQSRIDTIRQKLIDHAGLAESDFREVPAMFVRTTAGMVSYFPSAQNLLAVDDVLFLSDPEGPDVDGEDIWRKASLEAVDGLGFTTHFVDVYESYHELIGAIHCGTNVEHEAAAQAWWEVE